MLPLIWWFLGLVAPAVRSPVQGDQLALVLMKLPATLADFGIAGLVGWALRDRPRLAVVAVLAVLLHPAIAYVSGWWGQFESIYVLPLLAAWVLLRESRPNWAAVAIGIGLMTKPQALPLLVPFAAWYLRSEGFRGSAKAALIGAGVAVILWAPFLAAGGPAHYLGNLADYTAQFAVLSLRAWNPWWILQSLVGGGQLLADNVPIVGPLTLRWVGVAIAGGLEALVFLWVWRRPTPTGLAWGLAAAALAAFIGLTTMHERYAYAALVFLLLAWPDRLAIWTWVALSITITLNLVAAVPPSGGPGALIPVDGVVGIAGSFVMTTCLGLILVGLRNRQPSRGSGGAHLRVG